MENILNIIIPLILTGLGFITYKHPDISRKLLNIIFTFIIFFFILFFGYYVGSMSQFYQISTEYVIEQNKIGNVILSQYNNNNSLFFKVVMYFILIIIILAVFYFLSGMFDKVRKQEKINEKDSSEKTTL